MFTIDELILLSECINVMQGEYPFENEDKLTVLRDKIQAMMDEQ